MKTVPNKPQKGDTMIRSSQDNHLVERKSVYTLISKVKQKTAEQVSDAIFQDLTPCKSKINAITFGNEKSLLSTPRLMGHRDQPPDKQSLSSAGGA